MMVIGESLKMGEVVQRNQHNTNSKTLIPFKINVIIVSGEYLLPSSLVADGDWVIVSVAESVDVTKSDVIVKTVNGSPIRHKGDTYSDIGFRAKSQEYRICFREGVWEVL